MPTKIFSLSCSMSSSISAVTLGKPFAHPVKAKVISSKKRYMDYPLNDARKELVKKRAEDCDYLG
ncbi:hypothetical protein QW180_20090 [Vibrio sinaloensis]|nr:hypothetical protein [Vibrio sinaloensis]